MTGKKLTNQQNIPTIAPRMRPHGAGGWRQRYSLLYSNSGRHVVEHGARDASYLVPWYGYLVEDRILMHAVNPRYSRVIANPS